MWFLLLSDVFDKIVNSWLRCGKSTPKISSGVKSSRFEHFAFTCRRAENPDSLKYVRGREVTFWELLFQHLDNYQTPLAKNNRLCQCRTQSQNRSEFIFHAICNIHDWNDKTIFHQIQVCFDDFGKVQHRFITKPSKVLNNFRCCINIHFITSRYGKILEQAKFPSWAFRFQLSSFSTNALKVSTQATTDFPLPCSFKVTLLGCWNMSARYAKLKIKWLFTRLDIISFFPWTHSIDFNSYRSSNNRSARYPCNNQRTLV